MIAATAIFVRLTERFGGRVPDAGELAAVDQGTLRSVGLSWRKAATVLDLAQRFSDRRLSETELRELPDQEVIRQLTDVKGIGAWTVQGALLIALQRPDVIRPDGGRRCIRPVHTPTTRLPFARPFAIRLAHYACTKRLVL